MLSLCVYYDLYETGRLGQQAVYLSRSLWAAASYCFEGITITIDGMNKWVMIDSRMSTIDFLCPIKGN